MFAKSSPTIKATKQFKIMPSECKGKVFIHTKWKHLNAGKRMRNKPHKSQEKVEIGMTYEQYFRDRCHEMVCLAEELEHVLGREKALEIIGRAREKFIVEITKEETGPLKSFEEFKACEKAQNATPYFSNTLTLTYSEETPDKLRLHVTECLWAKVFQEMKATDLGYVLFCQPDYAYPQVCNPKIKMRRTKTLMQGDSYCNHTFYWEESASRRNQASFSNKHRIQRAAERKKT